MDLERSKVVCSEFEHTNVARFQVTIYGEAGPTCEKAISIFVPIFFEFEKWSATSMVQQDVVFFPNPRQLGDVSLKK